ncbi:MAG: hypothetical protein ACRD1T_20970 [Acidimicrobiia bacterium]
MPMFEWLERPVDLVVGDEEYDEDEEDEEEDEEDSNDEIEDEGDDSETWQVVSQ